MSRSWACIIILGCILLKLAQPSSEGWCQWIILEKWSVVLRFCGLCWPWRDSAASKHPWEWSWFVFLSMWLLFKKRSSACKDSQPVCFEEVGEYLGAASCSLGSWGAQRSLCSLISSDSWCGAEAPRILMRCSWGCPKHWQELLCTNKPKPLILSFYLWTANATLTWRSGILILTESEQNICGDKVQCA